MTPKSMPRLSDQRIAAALIQHDHPDATPTELAALTEQLLQWCSSNRVDIQTSEVVFDAVSWIVAEHRLHGAELQAVARNTLRMIIDSTRWDDWELLLDDEPVGMQEWLALMNLVKRGL